jgi:6-phosphogluconate dehydrogenase
VVTLCRHQHGAQEGIGVNFPQYDYLLKYLQAAMIGCGSMGGGMSLLFAENGLHISLQVPSDETVDNLIETSKKQGIKGKLTKHEDYESLCKSLGPRKVIFLSLPHGTIGDTVVEGLQPYLAKDDIIVDCENENWQILSEDRVRW